MVVHFVAVVSEDLLFCEVGVWWDVPENCVASAFASVGVVSAFAAPVADVER